MFEQARAGVLRTVLQGHSLGSKSELKSAAKTKPLCAKQVGNEKLTFTCSFFILITYFKFRGLRQGPLRSPRGRGFGLGQFNRAVPLVLDKWLRKHGRNYLLNANVSDKAAKQFGSSNVFQQVTMV